MPYIPPVLITAVNVTMRVITLLAIAALIAVVVVIVLAGLT